jgi:hypothetical protein
MATIKLPRVLDTDLFRALETAWKEHRNVRLRFPEHLAPAQVRTMISFLLPRLPSELASVILTELCERPGIPTKLLEAVLEKGDSPCKVAVCLRSDLAPRLKKKCLASGDPNVVEHMKFSSRKQRR